MFLVEYLYYIGYRIHRRYKGHFSKRLDGLTISVGNLTVGGTGKTPLVIEIAREAVRRGLSTCILTRGYKGDSSETLIVSRGEGPTAEWTITGDEPYLMAKKLKGVWIVKDKNRYRGGLVGGKKDIYILDDGFQHWPLHRDVDIVVIDATRPFGNGRLLPLGQMREPPSALRRADIIVINKTSVEMPELVQKIRRYNPSAPIYYSHYVIEGLSDTNGKNYPFEHIIGKRVFLFSGIGNPSYFASMLTAKKVNIAGMKAFRDHHHYETGDIRKILKSADDTGSEIILTTEKDMIKIDGLLDDKTRERVLSVKIKTEIKDSGFYETVFSDIKHQNSLNTFARESPAT
jgi:tetraacyldisaccharide 4'-kinase